MAVRSALKSFILPIWFFLYDVFMYIIEIFYRMSDAIYKCFHHPPIVLGIEDTINYILEHHCSVARYGDGEMKFVIGTETWFQKSNPVLKKRLTEILKVKDDNLIVCIPGIFENLDIYADDFKDYWRKYIVRYRRRWYSVINRDQIYYEAFVSRCYLPYRDRTQAKHFFDLWKKVWNDRDLLIVEGEKTRLGVGNDLFCNAKSLKRILGPNTGAFEYYDKFVSAVKQYEKDVLVLIALGPTATVMAADLSNLGYQAIDIGHLDIEYEWFLRKVNRKVPVEGKFVNEAGAGIGVGECSDDTYNQQVVFRSV